MAMAPTRIMDHVISKIKAMKHGRAEVQPEKYSTLLAVPDILARLARVPKSEIDEQVKNSDRNFKRRTTHQAYAKSGRIVEQSEK